jgi:hypothetical protein
VRTRCQVEERVPALSGAAFRIAWMINGFAEIVRHDLASVHGAADCAYFCSPHSNDKVI